MKTLKTLLAIALITGSCGSAAFGMSDKTNELKPVFVAIFKHKLNGTHLTIKAYSQESLKNATVEELCEKQIEVPGIHENLKCSKTQEHKEIAMKNGNFSISGTIEDLYADILNFAASPSQRSISTLVSYECENGYEFRNLLAGTFPRSGTFPGSKL